MLEFFQSKTAIAIGWVVGIVSFFLTIYWYYKNKKKSEITLFLEEINFILNNNIRGFKNVEIKFLNKSISENKDLLTTNIYIRNTGNNDISQDEIFENLTIVIPQEFIILDFELIAIPNSINSKIKHDKNKNQFTLEWDLLRTDEIFELKLLLQFEQTIKNIKKTTLSVQNKLGQIYVDGRIKNCSFSWLRIPNKEPFKLTIQAYLSVLLILIISMFFYFLMTNALTIKRNFIQEVIYNNDTLRGEIGFINNDTLIINDRISRQEYKILRNQQGLIIGERKYKSLVNPQLIFLIMLITLPSMINVYVMELRQINKKKSISRFLRNNS